MMQRSVLTQYLAYSSVREVGRRCNFERGRFFDGQLTNK